MQENETIEASAASETGGAAAPGEGRRWMSKREAVGRLLEISKSRDLGVDDVVAIQTAVRSLCKRIFDRERNLKRRRERWAETLHDPASGTGDFFTPPVVLDAVLAEQPMTPPAAEEGGE